MATEASSTNGVECWMFYRGLIFERDALTFHVVLVAMYTHIELLTSWRELGCEDESSGQCDSTDGKRIIFETLINTQLSAPKACLGGRADALHVSVSTAQAHRADVFCIWRWSGASLARLTTCILNSNVRSTHHTHHGP
eukprot:786879-Amphidinium_carterae.1